ncbi:MAG: class I SAM-dependent methyltransferase [Candidatus Natronoplasma sp.]
MSKKRKDFHRASKTFDSIADHFDKTRKMPWDEVVEFLEGCQGRLLDMGCGNGRHMVEGLEKGCEVVGIDASTHLLEISRKNIEEKVKVLSRVELLRSNVKNLPFVDRCFDSVIYVATLHHLKEGRVKSLKEAKRVLKIGGKILVSSWARELDRWDLDKGEREVMVPWHREDGEVVERFYHLYTLEELAKDVEKSGLSVEESFHSEGNNYVTAEKI